MLAYYHVSALLDQKPANLPQAWTRQGITFNSIMKKNDRKIDAVLLLVQCSGALNQIQRVCAGAAFARNRPFLVRRTQESDPQQPCFHDQHSSCFLQISAGPKRLNAGSSASSQSAFQPRCAVI